MGFVFDGLLAVMLVIGGLWWTAIRASKARDQEQIQEDARQAQEKQRKAEEEAQLHKRGVKLRCLACGTKFVGPLTMDGCPHCHLTALVITDAQFKRDRLQEAETHRSEHHGESRKKPKF